MQVQNLWTQQYTEVRQYFSNLKNQHNNPYVSPKKQDEAKDYNRFLTQPSQEKNVFSNIVKKTKMQKSSLSRLPNNSLLNNLLSNSPNKKSKNDLFNEEVDQQFLLAETPTQPGLSKIEEKIFPIKTQEVKTSRKESIINNKNFRMVMKIRNRKRRKRKGFHQKAHVTSIEDNILINYQKIEGER